MKTRIHVNQHNIRHNSVTGGNTPVFTVKTYKDNLKTNSLHLIDKDGNIIAEFVYSPDKPLPCGAKVWVEVDSDYVEVSNETEKLRSKT